MVRRTGRKASARGAVPHRSNLLDRTAAPQPSGAYHLLRGERERTRPNCCNRVPLFVLVFRQVANVYRRPWSEIVGRHEDLDHNRDHWDLPEDRR